MQSDAQNSYLEAQVLTATPQRQRLMLIDGAMRFVRQTLQFWQENQDERASETLGKSREIVSELLSSIDIQKDELTQRVASIYVFVFQNLTEAQLRRSVDNLNDVLDVLAIERETWNLVCEQMPEAPTPDTAHGTDGPQEILAPTSSSFSDADVPSGSFSLDA
jgi:flagellar protein FliS